MRRLHVWPWLLVAAGAAAYVNGIDAPFVFDDASLVGARDLRQVLPPWEAWHAVPASAAAGRPVVYYSFVLSHALGGFDPRGFRALNIAVHVLCALVLFGVVRRTLAGRRLGERFGRHAAGIAGAAALIWMLHPLQTECVDYISQRSESLMGLCHLLTLYCFIRSVEAVRGRRWSILAVGCCALGMASKESMVTAPLIVALYDRVFVSGAFRRLWRERRGFYAGLATTWVLLAALILPGPRAASVGFSHGVGAGRYALNQCIAVVDYLRLVLWPAPLVLDYGYPRTLGLGDVAPYAFVLGLVLVGTVVAFAVRPELGFLAVWALVILAPTSSIVPIVTEVAAERRMYLPLAGPVVLGVVAGHLGLQKLRLGRSCGTLLALAVAAALAWATVRRNEDYRSLERLWSTVVAARPENPRGHTNLGRVLQERGRLDEAQAAYRRALALDPEFVEAHNNLGSSLQLQGQTDAAIEHYRRALAHDPAYVGARYNLGLALQRQRRLDEAVVHYRQVLRLAPDHAQAHNNLGTALGSQGRLDEAIDEFRRALAIDPGYVEAQRNLDLALERRSRRGGRGPDVR